MFEFSITSQDGQARVGELVTPHGTVHTPVFMPVGTHGAVKGILPSELTAIGSQVVLSNTYHLHLRPGEQVVAENGGLHGFTQYSGPMLTDSGGFQVFSLGERGISGKERTAMRKVSEDGITFTSHLDGSRHHMRPEDSIAIQQSIGADIIMAFDQPVYGLSSEADAEVAMLRTQRWLTRSMEQWQNGDTQKQALFGIVQGGTHKELHKASAAYTVAQDLPGNAIGGLAVGESKEVMWEATASISALLPESKPRYFMGLGDPTDIVEATWRGVDMYDCVAPSRLARHGAIWIPVAKEATVSAFLMGDTEALLGATEPLTFDRINLKAASFAHDLRSLVPVTGWLGESIDGFSRATIHHYLREQEMLAARILTMHNIRILHLITEHMRRAITLNKFDQLRLVLTGNK